jgi:hypothetical protein
MYIISKFRDYYDSAAGLGIDKSCIYERNQFVDNSQHEFINNSLLFKGDRIGWSNEPYMLTPCSLQYRKPGKISYIKPFIIGFCGKTYVGYVFHYERTDMGVDEKIKISYDIDEINKLIEIEDNKSYLDKNTRNRINSFYNKFNNKEHTKLFLEKHVPIFVFDFQTNLTDSKLFDEKIKLDFGNRVHNGRFILYNPCLENYQFYKLFNTVQAFQKIQMYMQDILCKKEDNMIQISNKDKILQHGYDIKWSFRKEPKKL